MSTEAKCPVHHSTASGPSNRDWWPNQLKLELLHQHSSKSNPMGEDFKYAKEFKSLDLAAVKKDVAALMTDSQEWWPRTSATTARCSFAWRGIAPGRTASATVEGAAAGASSVSRRSTVGRTTSVWTRRAGSFGRLSRNMAARFRGPI